MFLSLLIIFFLWNSIFDQNNSFGFYKKEVLICYIIYANIIANFVLGTRVVDLAADINNGSIINLILKPVSLFKYYLSKDLADKLLNLIFVFLEVFLLVYFFKVKLFFPNNLLLALFFLICGTMISFYINLCLSFIGFWTTQVWAPRFLFLTLVFFVSGSYFPLDLLPLPIYRLILLTPFPYLFYLPTKVVITDNFISSNPFFYQMIFLTLFWVFITYKFAHWLWIIGIKNFSFWGR